MAATELLDCGEMKRFTSMYNEVLSIRGRREKAENVIHRVPGMLLINM